MTTMMTIDTTNMCSHLQKKLFLQGGEYYPIWKAIQEDKEITAVVRSGQTLHTAYCRSLALERLDHAG